jgi:multiple sugar transport system substrate-binding protein
VGCADLRGGAGPASRQLAESVAKYVIVDMFAKACAGAPTKEVITNAAAQLKGIYKAA